MKRLSRKVPNLLYHATYKRYLDSIKQHGLGGKVVKKSWEWAIDGVVCLAHNVDEAESYAENAEITEEDESLLDEIIVLEIDTDMLDKDLLFPDTNIKDDSDNMPLEYRGVIPFSAVTKIIDRSS